MQEGRKVGGDGVSGLGFPEVDVCPPGLHFLASSEGGGRTTQIIRVVDGSVPPDNWSTASLRGGS